MNLQDYRKLHNEELIDLLFTQEDRLPRLAIDEIARRGTEIMPMLAEIVMDRTVWTAELPDWWAPVHATYALGAIGGAESLVPLLSALRWADAYDNEWATEDLPSILGALGDLSFAALLAVVADRSAGWSARSIAMDALGSQALRFPHREEEAMARLGSIVRDRSEEHGARRSAAFVLLDFRRADYKEELMGLAHSEVRWQQQFNDYVPAFTPDEVARDLGMPRCATDIYVRDWLLFYEPGEILKRQERWAAEDRKQRPEFQPAAPDASGETVVIGRNALCPCGSGKPYKRCCWNKLH